MNLWARRLGLALLLALVFFSCEDDESTAGLPPNLRTKTFFLDAKVPSSVFWVDSVRTLNAGAILAGGYDDPQFGQVRAQPFIGFGSFTQSINIRSDAVYDSLVLYLRYNYMYGTGGREDQRFEVFQLTDPIEIDTNTNTKYAEDQQPVSFQVAEKTFRVFEDSLSLLRQADSVNNLRFGRDGRYIYHEEFRLSDNLGMAFYDRARTDTTFTDTEVFDEFFKGLSLVPDPDNSLVLGFAPFDPNPEVSPLEGSYLGLHYHFLEEDGDTTNVLQLFIVNIYYHNLSPNRNNFDRSGTPLSGLNALYSDFFPTDNFRYQQAGSGVNIRLDLSGFTELDSIDNLLLHNAQLELNGIGTSDGLDPINGLLITMTDSTLFRKNFPSGGLRTVQVETGGDPLRPVVIRNRLQPLILVYNEEDRQYAGTLTSYLQLVINNGTRLNQLILESNSAARFGSSVNRFRVHEDSIRVKLYYTRPNQ